MWPTRDENEHRRRRFWCSATLLFACLYILLALAKIVGGILLVTSVFYSPNHLMYLIIAIINFSAGCIILASGIICVISTLQPIDRQLNGVNLGFSIVSLLSACVHDAAESIATMPNFNCQRLFHCKRKIVEKRFVYPMLAFSVILLVLSISNIFLSSKKCCCSGSTGVEEELEYMISMDTTAYSINEDENQS